MESIWVAIPFRWLHLIAACALVGSVFFFHVILPLGTRGLDAQLQDSVYLRSRRGFKMTVHVSLLLLLVSGIFNALKNWHTYTLRTSPPGVMHGLFGLHLLLGLGGLTALMIMLAGREPRRSSTAWTRWALVALVLGIAAASTLKSVRESTMMLHAQSASQGTSH